MHIFARVLFLIVLNKFNFFSTKNGMENWEMEIEEWLFLWLQKTAKDFPK
jgi:hypothetical protein